MYVLNLWHNVSDYTEWKKLFDADPLGRERSGVRGYKVMRPTDDEHLVIGELEFDSLREAETFAGRLRELWSGIDESTMTNADLRILEVAESKEFLIQARRQVA